MNKSFLILPLMLLLVGCGPKIANCTDPEVTKSVENFLQPKVRETATAIAKAQLKASEYWANILDSAMHTSMNLNGTNILQEVEAFKQGKALYSMNFDSSSVGLSLLNPHVLEIKKEEGIAICEANLKMSGESAMTLDLSKIYDLMRNGRHASSSETASDASAMAKLEKIEGASAQPQYQQNPDELKAKEDELAKNFWSDYEFFIQKSKFVLNRTISIDTASHFLVEKFPLTTEQPYKYRVQYGADGKLIVSEN